MNKMKIIITLLSFAGALVLGTSAHESHDHSDGERSKMKAGPNGGRILQKSNPAAEFWVMPDKKIQITFLNDKAEPVAPAEQVVTVTTGQRTAPVTLAFERKGDVFVSTKPLTSDKQPAIVQIKPAPGAKAVVERFTLDLSICAGCSVPEYACTCH